MTIVYRLTYPITRFPFPLGNQIFFNVRIDPSNTARSARCPLFPVPHCNYCRGSRMDTWVEVFVLLHSSFCSLPPAMGSAFLPGNSTRILFGIPAPPSYLSFSLSLSLSLSLFHELLNRFADLHSIRSRVLRCFQDLTTLRRNIREIKTEERNFILAEDKVGGV